MFAGDRQDDQYLDLPNGLLDWRTGEVRPHDPDVPSMIRLPIEWNEVTHFGAADVKPTVTGGEVHLQVWERR